MKHVKMLGLAVLAAMSLTAFAAGSASATTVEVGGTTKNESLEITVSTKSGTSGTLKDTAGFSANTCTGGSGKGTTSSPYTGSSLTGLVVSVTEGSCTRPVTVHKEGTGRIEHIANTTNGTLISEGSEVTSSSAFGTLICKTGTTVVGTLTGKASGGAIADINAVINCGIIPSAKIEGTVEVTSPSGLGISA